MKGTVSRREFLRYLGLGAASILAAGCAPVPVAPATDVGVAPPEEAPAEPGEVAEVEPVTELSALPGPREDCLIYGRADIERFDTFNPHIPGADEWGTGMHSSMIEHLWYVNLADGEVIPWLATDYTYNADYTRLTISMREGAKWSDGEPVTANDVAFTTEMILNTEESTRHADWSSQVATVTATDDYTVDFDFKKSAPRFHTNWMAWVGACPVVPKHIWEKVDPVTFRNKPAIWSGPYKMIPTQRSDGMLVFERNDDYWAVEAGLAEPMAAKYFVSRIEPPADAEMQLAIDNGVDIPVLDEYDMQVRLSEQNPAFELAVYLDPCPRGFVFNTETIKRSEVRQAMQLCCNRDKIGQIVWRPPSHGTKYPWAGYGWFERFQFDSVVDQYPLEYNPDKAAQMLDDLGFTPGADGIRVDDEGNRLSYVLVTPSEKGKPEYEIAADLAAELANIGIDLQVKGFSVFTTMHEQWTTGSADMASIWLCGAVPDPYGFYRNFHSMFYRPIGEKLEIPSWETSPSRLRDERLDDVIDQLAVIDPMSDEASPLYEKALTYFLEDMPAFPSIETLYSMPFNNTYFTNWPKEGNWYMVPFTWWDTFKWVLHGLKKA